MMARMRAVLDRLCPVPSSAGAADAAAEDGCGQFAWSVGRELDLFADGFVADVESESALPKDGVFALLLQPVATVIYTGDRPNAAATTAGRRRHARMDLGRPLPDDAVGGRLDRRHAERAAPADARLEQPQRLPGVRQSVQFEVESLPLTLQIGGATRAAPQHRGDLPWQRWSYVHSRLGYGGGMSS